MDLDTAADELYGRAPGEFTAARDARAADAKRAGDSGLAASIKGLRRPTRSAWLANLLVRRRAEQVGELLKLGETIREAQQQLAGEELRHLSRRRHEVVAALAAQARELAREAGQPATDEMVLELESTLEAALADPAASDAVRAGRLTSALSYSGFGSVDPRTAATSASRSTARKVEEPAGPKAGGTRRKVEEPAAPKAGGTRRKAGPDDAKRRRAEIAAAGRAVREAEHDRAAAERALREAEGVRAAAERALREAARVRDASEQALRTAEARVAEAKAALERLRR